MKKIRFLLIILLVVLLTPKNSLSQKGNYEELYRPQLHFSPKTSWMNDPNGMLYVNGVYHLFFQYYPDSTVWGPMHWGHATSKDLVHWQEQPIALYPDTLGYIFSGSAVADLNNTSGLGKNGKGPLVAIFTHHNAAGEKKGRNDYQNQSIAFSLDEGKTWTKYAGNPVLKSPGIKDFRDPKVSWYDEGKKWIMTLAVQDRIHFYSSRDLKNWVLESEFGKDLGAHGGVWECPDLFPLELNGKKIWILFVSINPGGPNGGSATQYFTGHFDGKKFVPLQTDTRWLDYGPDDYAGVTWSNTGKRKIFLGWMSNWQYANVVPTDPWRSATTVPRELGLAQIGNRYFVTSIPVKELAAINESPMSLKNILVKGNGEAQDIGRLDGPARLVFNSDQLQSYTIILSGEDGQKLEIGYDKAADQYFIDRSNSGNTTFEKDFGKRQVAPRLSKEAATDLELIIDNASVELFADGGLSVMTAIFFSKSPFTKVSIVAPNDFRLSSLQFNKMKSIWK